MRELSPLAILLGVTIGVLFGAANAYIGLKVGMTISASIPAAVISMAVLRGILKRGTLLENNMVQTIGSAGESMAAGFIFTIPALFMFGFNPAFLEMAMWGAIGGLLGVFFMIPLRRALIVKEHETLPYPEGLACAEVLESGQRGGASARTVFWGLGVGAFYQVWRGLGFWGEKARYGIPQIRSEATLNSSPALLGVGYILGPRIAGYMLGGAVLGWYVIIPAIGLFGAQAALPVVPADVPIADMSPKDLWENYLRYIGAGAVVLGGLLSLVKSAPTIGSSIWHATAALFDRSGRTTERTDRDIPVPLLVLGLIGLGFAMWRFPQIRTGHWGAIAVIVFAFFFVTVSSRLVGLVGSSSNPISGMTIATILGTSLIFVYLLDYTGDKAKYAAISVGALVCIAIAVAGDCSQDLKTGFLVKATPWKQQIGEMIGVLSATAALAGVLLLLASTYGFEKSPEYSDPLEAPQANIMKLLVQGVLDKNLPWELIIIGMASALVIELAGIPSLPFAVGLYLPLYLTTPIMVGGAIRWVVDKARRNRTEGENPGVLGASGLVAGEGIIGVTLAGVAALISWWWQDPQYANPLEGGELQKVLPTHLMPWLCDKVGIPTRYGFGEFGFDLLPLAPFALLVIWLVVIALKRPPGAASTATNPPAPGDPPTAAPLTPLGGGVDNTADPGATSV